MTSGPDVVGIGRGGDYDVRLLGRQGLGVSVEQASELQHVQQASRAIAAIGASAQPEIVHPVQGLGMCWTVELGATLSDMGHAACHDRDTVTLRDPFPGQVVGPEFHAVARRPGIVIDQENIH
ncbi:hypothetical protein D3C73_1429480 [compost metagenome]